jgi:hypothetical protein
MIVTTMPKPKLAGNEIHGDGTPKRRPEAFAEPGAPSDRAERMHGTLHLPPRDPILFFRSLE